MTNTQRTARPGFSLVELMVVIGIIAVLIGLLMPMLGKAREHGRAMTCMSNLRQLGTALIAYTQQNDALMPGGGAEPQRLWDWIYWDNTAPYTDVSKGALMPFLQINSPTSASLSILSCPSDDTVNHQPNYGRAYAYHFSYSMNAFACDNQDFAYKQLNLSGAAAANFHITRVLNPAGKILFVEESELTIDDGLWVPFGTDNDQLSNRHYIPNDAKTVHDITVGRGNACFFDGHVEVVSRADSVSPKFWDPSVR